MKKYLYILVLLCSLTRVSASGLIVETMDEQVQSMVMTVLRLRVVNNTDSTYYRANVNYLLKRNQFEHIVVDPYDLGGAKLTLDTVDANTIAVSFEIDSIVPGIFPYAAGLCVGIHDENWATRIKGDDPSYIASANFIQNNNVQASFLDTGLPDAFALSIPSGATLYLSEGDSVPLAWQSVPGALKYTLSVFNSDSNLVYQKETYRTAERVLLDTGAYLWKVQSRRPNEENVMTGASAINATRLNVRRFSPELASEWKSMGVKSVSGRKDTPMLEVIWGEHADLREWDRPHLNHDYVNEVQGYSCWAIGIKNLNAYYGGTLTLDEIIWYVKKDQYDAINAFWTFGDAGGDAIESQKGLKYALDSNETYQYISNSKEPLTYGEIKEIIDDDKLLYIKIVWPISLGSVGHFLLIDGYGKKGDDTFVELVNIDNYGNIANMGTDSLLKMLQDYIIIDRPPYVRNMSSDLGVFQYDRTVDSVVIKWTDSDEDGMVDFDEKYRFGTNPYYPDSDSDGVFDKDEINSYIILEKVAYNLEMVNSDSQNLKTAMVIKGIASEYMADVDGDGIRAELDPDSDDDGLNDGVDSNPYNRSIPLKDSVMEKNMLPKDVVFYAREHLTINDGSECTDKYSGKMLLCSYVSENTDLEYGVTVGVNVSAAIVYAKNNVVVRSNKNNTFLVNYYGDSTLKTIRQDGRFTIEKYYDKADWPWNLNIELEPFETGDSILVVHNGDTITLNNGDRFAVIKVESGGIMYLPVGNVYTENFQLDAGAKLKFSEQVYETNLYVKNKILWHGDFAFDVKGSFSPENIAKNKRMLYYGKERVTIDSDWYGTFIAPNATIVLGQTSHKEIYGQVYARNIITHQYSDIHNVPFNPVKPIVTTYMVDFLIKGGNE